MIWEENREQKTGIINNVIVEIVQCKDCKRHEFKDEIWYDQGPIHIIGANNVHVCHFWGGKEGCVTNPEGWCFMGEKA